ncbi:unnamed protein product [Larinioides sclopetarius]|uniref:Uncharacterized protein n=1 Tax=Larinioides sclopetarius TaxID=280406 RepID=A0AAV2A3M4_9ARAC
MPSNWCFIRTKLTLHYDKYVGFTPGRYALPAIPVRAESPFGVNCDDPVRVENEVINM